jgi:hypothetical protein
MRGKIFETISKSSQRNCELIADTPVNRLGEILQDLEFNVKNECSDNYKK